MRMSVTQIRIAILVLNLVLTLLIGAQAIYGVVHKPEPPPRKKPLPTDLLAWGSSANSKGKSGYQAVVQVKEFGRRLVAPPPPPPPEKVADAPKVDPGLTPENELPPGPLEATWEYVQCIIIPGDPSASVAVLEKKDLSGASLAPGAKKSAPSAKRVIRSQTPGGRSPRASVPVVTAASSKISLRPMQEWKDDDAGINVMVKEVRWDQFIYMDTNQPGRYFALVRKMNEIYVPQGPNGEPGIKRAEEPADPAGIAQPKDKASLLLSAPDREKKYQDWLKEWGSRGSGAPAPVKGGSPNAAHGANTGGRPLTKQEPTKQEQVKQLQEAIKGLEQNPDYLKTPKAERDKLNQLLKGKK